MSESNPKYISLFQALAKAQLEIEAPEKDKQGAYKNRYSSIDAVLKSCRETLARHGLTLDSSSYRTEEGWVLRTTLYYEDQTHTIEMPLMIEKSTPQGFASALTYARRYSISCILSLPSDEDDDGEKGEKEAKVSLHTRKSPQASPAPSTEEIEAWMIQLRFDCEQSKVDSSRLEEYLKLKGKEVGKPYHAVVSSALRNPTFVAKYQEFMEK